MIAAAITPTRRLRATAEVPSQIAEVRMQQKENAVAFHLARGEWLHCTVLTMYRLLIDLTLAHEQVTGVIQLRERARHARASRPSSLSAVADTRAPPHRRSSVFTHALSRFTQHHP